MMTVLHILISVGTILLCGYLWHMGGQGHKWMRVMVGGVIGLAKVVILWNIFALLYWLAFWAMTAGFSYGLTAPPHKFWVWCIGTLNGRYSDPIWRSMADNGQINAVEVATRATCGFFWSLAGAVFAFLTGRWVLFACYSLVATVLVTIFGRMQDVKISETGTGMSVGLAVLL